MLNIALVAKAVQGDGLVKARQAQEKCVKLVVKRASLKNNITVCFFFPTMFTFFASV